MKPPLCRRRRMKVGGQNSTFRAGHRVHFHMLINGQVAFFHPIRRRGEFGSWLFRSVGVGTGVGGHLRADRIGGGIH